MSAVNDATSHARDDLTAARAVLADLAQQLTAIPGWLRVGDPGRHAGPADQAAAAAAAALGERIDRVRRAIAAMADRLEQVLGEPPPDIWAFVTYSQWLESLPPGDAQQLLDGLVTSPERLLVDPPAMTIGTAQAILHYIAAHGGKVGDGEAFRQGVPLNLQDMADLQATGWRLRGDDLPASGWAVLLPVRLETRFFPPDAAAAAGTPEAAWRLRVRVEPDAPVVAGQPAGTSAGEARLVARCWTSCAGSLDGDLGGSAFARLAAGVGGGRAEYLLRTVPVVRSAGGFTAAGDYPDRPDIVPPLVGLPAMVEIWGGPEDAPELLLTLHPDRDAMAAQATIHAVAAPGADGQTPRAWWNSYAAAADVGTAGEIVFGPDRPALPILLCVGHTEPGDQRGVDPAALFRAHADAGRLGTLAPLTPTNTVAGGITNDLGKDPEPWLGGARRPADDLAGLAPALIGRAALPGVPVPDRALADVATTITQALWPLLWQRSFKDIADAGEGVWRLGEWASRHLHAFGPYPVLRVDDLPYGVLPVADYSRWVLRPPVDKTRAGDPRTEMLALATLPVLTQPLLQEAVKQGNAAGADTDGLLDVLEHVPTSRAYGSRQLPATILWDPLMAALGGSQPGEQILLWEAEFAYLRSQWPPGPRRRYTPVLDVEPFPGKVDPDHRESLRLFLKSTWGALTKLDDLAEQWQTKDGPPAILARLVRHCLLLTQAEVTRLRDPAAASSFMLSIGGAEQFRDLAIGDRDGNDRVTELPQFARQLVGLVDSNPRAAVVCRQFEDVRTAVRRLGSPEPALAGSALPAVLDLTSHRVDAWWTGLAHRRLQSIAARGGQPRLGCYGWVDDLAPNPDPTSPTTAGLIHAPGYPQALTAAVLRDQAVHHAEQHQWDIALDSATVRVADSLAGQVRAGIHLSEALGREIERRVGEPGLVLALREQFPGRPEWQGRRVCDGQQVLDAAALPAGIDRALFDDLRKALDTYADLLVTDALHDIVEGRATAAGEALEAAAGLGAPPELRLLRTQRSGGTVKTIVTVALPWLAAWDDPVAADPASPLPVADPALAALLAAELPAAVDWTWTGGGGTCTLSELGLEPAEAALFPITSLAARAAGRLGAAPDGGTASAAYQRASAICGALGGVELLDAARPMLLTRLTRLRELAAQAIVDLGARGSETARVGLRWGLSGEPASSSVILQARLDQLGEPTSDPTASATQLGERIRALLPSALAMPLACPVGASPGHPMPAGDWLEVLAAVRPALARLELAQLTADLPWQPSTSDDQPIWAGGDPTTSGHREVTVTYRPSPQPGADAAREAVIKIDGWAETVPSPAQATWAAFGYDAPRARPPQAILLVVPADVDAPKIGDDIRGAVLETRRLARVRSLRPPLPAEVGLVLPTSVVIDAVVPAGATLAVES